MKPHHFSSPPPSSTSSALFRARDRYSGQERFFDTSLEAFEWMYSHQNWTLAKRETVKWTFPLDRIVDQQCWVKVEAPK